MKRFQPWRVPFDKSLDLSEWPTRLSAKDKKIWGKGSADETFERLNKLQNTLYAAKSHGLLLVLQGMDTAGKDGVIRHVFTHVSPLGVRAHAFAAPSEEEKRHDFLWRIHSKVPAKGEMVIFNRSHYEDVLVPHIQGLLKPKVLRKRLTHLNRFEDLLHDEKVRVIKCFLHISKDEQKHRLQARMDDPHKQWKLQASDFEDRQRWSDFMQAYAQTLSATSTQDAPWYVIPADDKSDRDRFLAELLVATLEDMDLRMPKPSLKLGDYSLS